MKWLQKWMAGRYGNDPFNYFLFVLFLLFTVLYLVFSSVWLYVPAIVFLTLSLIRMLSKRRDKRTAENRVFLRVLRRITGPFRRFFYRRKDQTHVFFPCTACGATLRLPKNVGQVTVTCPRCAHKMDGRA